MFDRLSARFLLVASLVASSLGCAPMTDYPDEAEETEQSEKPFSSAAATLVTLELDGELSAPWQSNTTKLIKDQLFYTVGQLNHHDSVGRLDKVVITNVTKSSQPDGWMKVRYHASLPVGWGSKTHVPTQLQLTLPRKIGPKSLAAFMNTYAATCGEPGGHSVTAGNFWYHYRPAIAGCVLDPNDVVAATATVHISAANQLAKFPEYHKVWEDGALRVVAVFGKYDDFATSQNDAGIWAYNQFVDTVRAGIGADFVMAPASVPASPGVSSPDVTFTGTYAGRAVSITALLIDSPKIANATFDARYAGLSKNADIILYNGHAGLGANIRALADKGQVTTGQYTMFFMNGCDTFAYLDDKLAKRFAAANPDDPDGTKYLDVLVNLMPSYFHSMPSASLALISAMADPDGPRTYEQIFSGIDKKQVIVVTGDEDNVFQPAPGAWTPIDTAGAVERGQALVLETHLLPAGTYVIEMSEGSELKGDVDLHVGVGYEPTLELWDHRPYLYGSSEKVTVVLAQPSKMYLMMHGYEDSPAEHNHFRLSID